MKLIGSEEAASEVVGHVIILGLTITGIALIMLVGVPSIHNMQDMINVRNAEQTFTVLDSRTSKVALGESIQQLMNINLGGGTVTVVPNSSSTPSYMLFEMKNATTTMVNINISMGKIIYRLGDREIAYEGGGVWSKYPEGSVMLSPPEFNYNGITITLPVVSIYGNSSISGNGAASVQIEKNSDGTTLYPTSNPDYTNPISLNITETTLTIKSEYYDAWGEYFRSINLVHVDESEVNKTVIVTLENLPVVTNFSYGALASETIELGNNAETDSYNSSKGNYLISRSDNGSIRATQKIQFPNSKATVWGSAMTGGVITGKGEIKKDAYAQSFGSVTVPAGRKHGPVSGFSLGNTYNLVQRKINEYKAANDNTVSGCAELVGTQLNVASGCTISGGKNYYLTKFDIQNNKILIFNTSAGEINIGVDAPVNLNTGANITLTGSTTNPVRLYLNKNIEFGNNIKLNHPTYNDTAALFQVISSSHQEIEFGTGSEFCGFIWAPEAEIENGNNAELFGAIVGREFEIGTGPTMHYDEALQNLPNNWGEGTTLVYLYITRYDASVAIR